MAWPVRTLAAPAAARCEPAIGSEVTPARGENHKKTTNAARRSQLDWPRFQESELPRLGIMASLVSPLVDVPCPFAKGATGRPESPGELPGSTAALVPPLVDVRCFHDDHRATRKDSERDIALLAASEACRSHGVRCRVPTRRARPRR